ncbi:hypothetical protein [Cupriavidus numazuensis]|uniref:hypothetical protein n=1 Tax=Cupriavidus numazuensis TaxID=221992 RepID=UPI001BA70EC4|nr:hypothetical protein [Cupriavidus numazuensis]
MTTPTGITQQYVAACQGTCSTYCGLVLWRADSHGDSRGCATNRAMPSAITGRAHSNRVVARAYEPHHPDSDNSDTDAVAAGLTSRASPRHTQRDPLHAEDMPPRPAVAPDGSGRSRQQA